MLGLAALAALLGTWAMGAGNAAMGAVALGAAAVLLVVGGIDLTLGLVARARSRASPSAADGSPSR